MPHILKKPTNTSPGIVMFTHKERAFLHPSVPGMAALMTQLAQRYVIGMHWGSPHADVPPVPFVDFHLGGQGTLSLRQPSPVPHFPLCSRNFLPPCFHHNPNIAKQWDILAVAGPRRLKRLDELLVVLRKVYDRRPETRVLIISACDNLAKRDPELDYVELYDDYLRLFSDEERKRFTLMMLEGPSGMALPLETMAYFYNASRTFTLFTNKEGESRVISEALLCGVPVVVKRHLEGGGRDYLNESNSRQFGTLDEAAEQFLSLLSPNPPLEFDTAPLMQAMSEPQTIPQLEAAMREVFAQKGLTFEGSLDATDLSFKLPGHYYLTLPPDLRQATSNDLRSPEAAYRFIARLLGIPISGWQRWQLRQVGRCQGLSQWAGRFLKRPSMTLRQQGLLPPRPPKRATQPLLQPV